MRPPRVCGGGRAPVRLLVVIDGIPALQRTYEPRGLFRDGNSVATAHLPLGPGEHDVEVAIGDSLIQQVLGHGVAAKLSARLGEGVLNGLLTARLGLAAIEVARPLPFSALPKPALSDIAGDLLRRREEQAG